MAFVATTYPDMSQLPYTTVSTGKRNPHSAASIGIGCQSRILNTEMDSGFFHAAEAGEFKLLSQVHVWDIPVCDVPIER